MRSNTSKALKLQLLATVEEVYYRDLHDDNVGYALVFTQLLLDHLWLAYGQIDDEHLATNTACMSAPESPPTPINNLFGQLKSCMKFFSKGRDPIIITNAVRTGANCRGERSLLHCK